MIKTGEKSYVCQTFSAVFCYLEYKRLRVIMFGFSLLLMKSLLRGGAFMLLVLEMSFTMPDRKTEDDSVVCKICS